MEWTQGSRDVVVPKEEVVVEECSRLKSVYDNEAGSTASQSHCQCCWNVQKLCAVKLC